MYARWPNHCWCGIAMRVTNSGFVPVALFILHKKMRVPYYIVNCTMSGSNIFCILFY
jgi:hypothetical protein